MTPLLIVAALDREIAPLTRGWKSLAIKSAHGDHQAYQRDDVFVAVGGIGAAAARRVTDAACRQLTPGLVISAGLAGALQPSARVAQVIQPAEVINEADGQRLRTLRGQGLLVTGSSVADAATKRDLSCAYSAEAVDMEAYAVGDVARIHSIPFLAIKAVSDEADTVLPPLQRFISPQGHFQTGRFGLYVALRPWHWRAAISLGRDSARATATLAHELERLIADWRSGLYNKTSIPS